MSFILDALKKSEQERQAGQGPGLLEARALPRRGGLPWWALLLVLVLLANLGLLVWMLVRSESVAPAPDVAPPVAAASVASPAVAPALPQATGESTLPAEAPAEIAVAADDLPAIELAPAPAPVVAPPREPPTPASASPPADLAGLRLSLHVYAESPAQRVVIIDGQSLREGQALPNGARLERVTPDGAVLLWQGRRFTLRPGE